MTARVSYVHIDSGNRLKHCINKYYDNLYTPPAHPISFTHASSIITIHFPNHQFQINDKIIINNVTSKNTILQDVVSIKKHSEFMRINHPKHGMSFYGLYDDSDESQFLNTPFCEQPHLNVNINEIIPDFNDQYIYKSNDNINLFIEISNITGMNIENTSIGNIPINYINGKHRVYLIFVKTNGYFDIDPDNYLIKLQDKCTVNYRDAANHFNLDSTLYNKPSNTIYIKYLNLYGIPLNLINTGSPISNNNIYPYSEIIDVTADTLQINTHHAAIVDNYNNFYQSHEIILQDNYIDANDVISSNRGGGCQVYIKKIEYTLPGYPNSNNFQIPLNKTYTNISSVEIIESIFPNSQNTINTNNNKLYWKTYDGNTISSLSVPPGNYSIMQLKLVIEKLFAQVSQKNMPSHSDQNTIDLDICESTNKSTFTYWKTCTLNNSIMPPLIVPDTQLQIIFAHDFRTNFGITGTNIVPQKISPFVANTETFYVYFTPNTHANIPDIYPNSYHNLYKYTSSTDINNGYVQYNLQLDTHIAILINFSTNKMPNSAISSFGRQEINSINTSTIFENFEYDYNTSIIKLHNHNLQVTDLLLTDKLIDNPNNYAINFYEIIKIIDNNNFAIQKIKYGTKYKMIYDYFIVNFNAKTLHNDDILYWLDTPITENIQSKSNNLNTLSVVDIRIPQTIHKLLTVVHPNHNLHANDKIILKSQSQISNVPLHVLNNIHIINKILNANSYQIILNDYQICVYENTSNYIVNIKYSAKIQMYFNYKDSLGKYLGFRNVGSSDSITPFSHTISNTDTYIFENKDSATTNNSLMMTGFNYFYLVCPQLATLKNNAPIANIFSKIRWFENPGNVVFDSYIPCTYYFDAPISKLSFLDLSLINPDGSFVDLNNQDYSFTIKITESIQ